MDIQSDRSYGRYITIFPKPKKTLWGYGVGHIENDLCATLWFSYLLVFLEQVTKLSPGKAGILMVIGQLTDGLATPIVGLGLDKIGLCGSSYGRRKSWHMLGTLLVSISFAFIYTPPFGHDPTDESTAWSQIKMVSSGLFETSDG